MLKLVPIGHEAGITLSQKQRIPCARPARAPVENPPPQWPSCLCPAWICIPWTLSWGVAYLKSHGDTSGLFGGCYNTLQCMVCNLLTSVCHMQTGVLQHVHSRAISPVNGMKFSKGSTIALCLWSLMLTCQTATDSGQASGLWWCCGSSSSPGVFCREDSSPSVSGMLVLALFWGYLPIHFPQQSLDGLHLNNPHVMILLAHATKIMLCYALRYSCRFCGL